MQHHVDPSHPTTRISARAESPDTIANPPIRHIAIGAMLFLFLLVFILIALPRPLGAKEQISGDPIQVSLSMHKIVTSADGTIKLIKADHAAPGEIIEYRVTYINRGDKPVRDLNAVLPVPVGMKLVAQSATPALRYASIGAGHEPLPMMRKLKRADGVIVEEAVPEHEFRSLQWRFAELTPGRSVTVSARARLDPILIPSLARP